jgi:hypothetical protein
LKERPRALLDEQSACKCEALTSKSVPPGKKKKREWGIKESDGVNSSMRYSIQCKNLCKCHNVPQHNNEKESIN